MPGRRIARSAEVRAVPRDPPPPRRRKLRRADLERATGGVLARSHVANLRKGRIGSPGFEKMSAIAKAMGFPPEAWFEEIPASGGLTAPQAGQVR
jgi:transcriptional regulator with XRE-family HTH domain